jgi:hypothetical protein
LEADANPFALITAAHLYTARTRHDPQARFRFKRRLVRLLYRHGWDRQRILDLFAVIDWMMRLPDALEQALWNEIQTIEGERKMAYVTSVERLAIQRGLQEGEAKGRVEGRRGPRRGRGVSRAASRAKPISSHDSSPNASARCRPRSMRGSPRPPPTNWSAGGASPRRRIALDRLDIEFAQFEDADGPVIDERRPRSSRRPVAMGVLGPIPKQRPVEDPDGIDRLQRTIVAAALQLLAEQVRPGVEDARGEVGEDQQLDLDLKDPPRRVARLHVHDGQLVVEGLALVVGVEDVDVGDRGGEILHEQRIEKVDQQVAMVVGPEQGLEDAVDLGIDGAVHTKSVLAARGVDKVVTPGAQAAPGPIKHRSLQTGTLRAPVSAWGCRPTVRSLPRRRRSGVDTPPSCLTRDMGDPEGRFKVAST